jgi:hypothetical protein
LKVNFAKTQINGLDERLMNVLPESQWWLLEQQGGRWGQHGWYLSSGEKGNLRILFPGKEPGIVKFRLWLFSPGHLSVSVREKSRQHLIAPHELDGRVLQIEVHGLSELLVESTSELSEEQLVLDRYAAVWFPPDSQLPSLLPIGFIMVLVFAIWASILIYHLHGSMVWVPVLGAGAIVLAAMMGLFLRWTLLDIVRGLPADPDAGFGGYFSHAMRFTWLSADHGFYSGNFNGREPFHVAALNAWLKYWGENMPAVRLYTVFLSTVLIVATGIFIWKLSGQTILGVTASWVVALSPAWIDESVRGLRLETQSLLLLAALSTWLWTKGWPGAILLGMLSGFLALVQSTAMGIVLPLIWFGWFVNLYRNRRSQTRVSPAQWIWCHLAMASIIAVGLYAPHLYGLYKVHGDPSWPSYGYARWNANFEFPQRFGTEGFPSREEYEKNTYAGPRMTYGEYLFGLHTIPQSLYGQCKGWAESIVYMSVSPTPRLKSLMFMQQASGFSAMLRHITGTTVLIVVVLLLLTALGWIDLWHRAEYWWVPLLSLLGIWYAAFLYSVRVIEPFRHTGHVYPLLLFCFLWGGVQVYQRLIRRVHLERCDHHGK